jgi:hypothetical protein
LASDLAVSAVFLALLFYLPSFFLDALDYLAAALFDFSLALLAVLIAD